jgi:hypothetical protein
MKEGEAGVIRTMPICLLLPTVIVMVDCSVLWLCVCVVTIDPEVGIRSNSNNEEEWSGLRT